MLHLSPDSLSLIMPLCFSAMQLRLQVMLFLLYRQDFQPFRLWDQLQVFQIKGFLSNFTSGLKKFDNRLLRYPFLIDVKLVYNAVIFDAYKSFR